MRLAQTHLYLILTASAFVLQACAQTAATTASPVCGGSATVQDFAATSSPTIGSWSSGNNVMSVTVNGSLCTLPHIDQYPNEPCVSVTICSISNPSSCQTISNILLDTGSYGLRIFNSVITVPLTPISNGASTLGECVQFGDGSSEWGPVEYAYVQLGNEPKVAVPILAIDSNYGTAPDPCSPSQSKPDTSPSEAGFNGILGVGLAAQDCGSYCVTNSNSEQYYTCTGGNCACGATVALAAQVENPVALIPTDNNGVVMNLPSVAAAGASSISGNLYLGVGTQANNATSGATMYSANSDPTSYTYLQFSSVFSAYSSQAIPSFIDSGSSVLFFPQTSNASLLPDCGNSHGSGYSGWFCPSSTYSGSATNYSFSGSPSGAVSFTVGNAYTLLNSGNSVLNVGVNTGSGSNAMFDWGLPFFFGRKVFVGIAGTSSSLGTGPYWAY